MMELLQPYLTQGLTIVIQIAALIVFYGLYLARQKFVEYLNAHLDAKQRELLHLLAREAYAFAETSYRELKGHEKLAHALDYLETQAKARGIPFEAEQAKAAIEQAWLEIEGLPKRLKGGD